MEEWREKNTRDQTVRPVYRTEMNREQRGREGETGEETEEVKERRQGC